jgi:hypothetical protein
MAHVRIGYMPFMMWGKRYRPATQSWTSTQALPFERRWGPAGWHYIPSRFPYASGNVVPHHHRLRRFGRAAEVAHVRPLGPSRRRTFWVPVHQVRRESHLGASRQNPGRFGRSEIVTRPQCLPFHACCVHCAYKDRRNMLCRDDM